MEKVLLGLLWNISPTAAQIRESGKLCVDMICFSSEKKLQETFCPANCIPVCNTSRCLSAANSPRIYRLRMEARRMSVLATLPRYLFATFSSA